jgi:hypothetical protein
LVFDEGQVAMLEVLRDDVSNKTGKIACSISLVQKRLEFFAPSLVDEFKIVVLLIYKLPLDLVHPLLLGKNISQNHSILSATCFRAFIEGKA